MTVHEQHQVDLPADAASASAARALVVAVARQHNCLADADVDDLCVAVGEAFANVVRHSGTHANESVRLRVERGSGGLVVHLVYRGEPFDTTPLPPSPDDMASGGYGLFIMRTLADLVEFNFSDGQTHLHMEKRCPAVHAASPSQAARTSTSRFSSQPTR